MAVGFGPRAGCHSRGNGDTAASIIFGGAPVPSSKPPVASAASNGPPAARLGPRPLTAGGNAAGALGLHAPDTRMAAEVNGFRRQRAPRRDERLQYDEHMADVEDQAFSVLRRNLSRLERKADREHSMYEGSAGYSSEKRAEKDEQRQECGGARPKLATPRGDNNSVASLISHPHMAAPAASHRPRSASPGRRGGPSPRPEWNNDFNRSSYAAPRRAVPPLQMGGGAGGESLAGRIASRRQQNSARRMAGGGTDD
jgi:hypothetical protein